MLSPLSYDEALQLLELPHGAQDPPPSLDAVRRAFRRQALKWHPDKQRTQPQQGPGPLAEGEAQQPLDADAQGPLEAEERFKRLAAAYHLLLRAASAFPAATPTGPDGPQGPGAPWTASAGAPQGPFGAGFEAAGAGPQAQGQAWGDDALADAVSVDLLLQEAARMRLSEFDMLFLHQRAAAGPGGLPPVWPESVQSVDDLWRRIRRRVERRRKRADAQQAGGSAAPAPSSKWGLLAEFAADLAGLGRNDPDTEPEPDREAVAEAAVRQGAGSEPAGTGGRAAGGAAAAPGAEAGHGKAEAATGASGRGGVKALAVRGQGCSGQQQTLPLLLEAGYPGQGGQGAGGDGAEDGGRRRGRLPRGFYMRWVRRIILVNILWVVFASS
ncbi:hypothetical protein HYH03_004745 [Edaphochlamys debaryana]|uniref:J domain-containing protein n=1 Tax=Edaphochlamys debaryana TaxID=47281 RepID=A0A836C1U7_9CHLO|nr:hypothetical protein HYH03_004745 [Edaphochlamys debaryana]|eukprot:KAG2497155.1 hypothetical protein HYH03_004745 [Edaphochlamys debaryana]